ncbi:prostaglandin E2 receptor EP4 subtype-like isoform X1 [Macrobrachium rosenbergii]|uniref:prostaglandin E2 receptor EP4 subtype-like isoform X1 n=1 Tax=Macrobrachium rosenbergii TaxID=79674 RepID=UPI0034D79D9A
MLSTQTTETTVSPHAPESPVLDLTAPMCKGVLSANATTAVGPILTTIATVLSTTAGGPPEVVCEGAANCTDITEKPGATIVSPILLGLTGTVGQVWALVYLHCSTKRQNQRTVFYLLLCILIWTDFFGKILTTPAAIVSYSNRYWVGGKPMCNFHGFSMVFISILTHFTVSAMAVERYLGICHGYFYSRNVTPSRCKMVFCGIWIFCFMVSVLPLFSVGQFYLQYPGTWCFTNIHLCDETPLLQKMFTTAVGVMNVCNLIIIVVCNVFVVGSLLKMRITPHSAFEHGQPHRSRKKNEQELQMVIVLIVITCIFVVSWAPLDAILVGNRAWPPHDVEDHYIELVAIRLCSLNQIVDPFAYIICRVVFRSRFWSCCRRAIIGRGWSRRGEGSHFQISSLLHNRKFSRTQSPPKDHIATVKEVNQEFREEAAVRPEAEKTTRAPSVHKSYYSDSGTGSYSGVETPLVDKVEEPSFSMEALQEAKGSVLQHSLAKSLSVAIPIPLFTSEQYRVAELGREGDGTNRDVYYLVDASHNPIGQRISNPDNMCQNWSSASRGNNNEVSFITVTGCDDAGVYRSNSWSCQSIKPPQPQYRTQSTQTLSTGHGSYPYEANIFTKPSETQTDDLNGLREQNGNNPTPDISLGPENSVELNGNVKRFSSLTVCQAHSSEEMPKESSVSACKRPLSACLSDTSMDALERNSKFTKS